MTPAPKKHATKHEPEPEAVKVMGWAYKTYIGVCRNLTEIEACESHINVLGDEGWELVGVNSISDTYVLYHFKRPA